MGNLIYILFIAIFSPIFLMMLLLNKKERLPVIFVLVGIFISVFSSEVNGLLLKLLEMSRYDASVALTPITEELLKALPILFFAIVVSDKRETLLMAAMATGIGFGVLENAYYLIASQATFSFFSALIRGFGTALMHGMCTLMVGFCVSFIRKRQKLFAVGVFACLTAAVTYHSIFNMLIQSRYPIVGALLPIITYLPFLSWRYARRK